MSIKLIAIAKREEIERQAIEQTQQAEENAATAVAAPWDRANVQIQIDAQRRIRSIQQALEDSTISERQAAIQIAAVWQQTFAQMRDNLADQLESLFDDLTSGNIGKRFLSNFKKLVFQMAASWLLGLKQMQSSSAVSFGGGGLLGSLLGGVFGISGLGGGGGAQQGTSGGGGGGILGSLFGGSGGSGGAGGILGGLGGLFAVSSGSGGSSTAVGGSSSINSLPLAAALGLSSGLGSGAGSVLPAGASAAIGLGKGALGLAGRVAGLQALAGLSLFGLAGKAGPGGGAALGVLGGLLTTGALLASFPALGAALLLGLGSALTFGIGAIIGGLVGLFAGLFGSSKKKRAIQQLDSQIKDSIKKITDAYNSHQLDFDPAISQLEALRADGQQKMHSLGGDTHNRVQVPINQAEEQIKKTEAERQRRLAISFGPAQFRVGGYVSASLASPYPSGFGASAIHYAGGGEVPAILHAGEFVMRPEAVNRIGVGPLQRLNSGASAGNYYHVELKVSAIDAKSFGNFLANGGMVEIWKAFRRAGNEGLRA